MSLSLKEQKKTNKQTNEKKIIVIIKQNLAPREGIQIPECGKFLLVKSGIQQIFAVESGILGSEDMRGIRNSTND